VFPCKITLPDPLAANLVSSIASIDLASTMIGGTDLAGYQVASHRVVDSCHVVRIRIESMRFHTRLTVIAVKLRLTEAQSRYFGGLRGHSNSRLATRKSNLTNARPPFSPCPFYIFYSET
ncbi:hypothetical protein L9F63_016028, partial [Diploptera punctata]